MNIVIVYPLHIIKIHSIISKGNLEIEAKLLYIQIKDFNLKDYMVIL